MRRSCRLHGVVPLALALCGVLAPSIAAEQTGLRRESGGAIAREAIVSAGVLGSAFFLDRTVGTNFPDRGPSWVVEEPGEVFGGATFLLASAGGVAGGGLAMHRPALLRTGEELGIAVVAASLAAWSLKQVTRRERPDGSNRQSFPSGHAAGAFAAATVVDREIGGAVGWAAYGAAASAAYARVADNRHFLSDVVAGAMLGRLIGRLVTLHRAGRPPSAPSVDLGLPAR